jgi:uncharacterized membrane protein YgcG
MHCPYCRTPLTETVAECPACKLTLARANTLLGPVPRLSAGLTDSSRVLRRSAADRVRRALEHFHRRFPQLAAHVVLRDFLPKYPIELQAFWLFNTAGLCKAQDKAGCCRTILLAIDPPQGLAALTLGYGLEPFVRDEALDRLLELAGPAWRGGHFASGILTVLQGLEALLADACESLAGSVGLSPAAAAQRSADF